MKRRRNEKTGEIIEYDEEVIYYRKLTPNGHEDWTPYHPEDWEDYEPAEPLIKDEKVRKAVRYWLKCNSGFSAKVICKNNSTTFISEYGEILTFDHAIDFNDARMYGEWCNRSFSTEALCGKEEE